MEPLSAIDPTLRGVPAAPPRLPGNASDEARLREVSQEFESIFVEQMLSAMRDTLSPESRLLHGGFAEEVFDDMLYREYARILSKSGGFGLADMVFDELSSKGSTENIPG